VVSQNRGSGGLAVARGEVWLAGLDPTVGSEIQKTHPCRIVSPPEMNDRLPAIIAAPMTTGSRPAPSRIPVRFQGRSGLILLEQIRAFAKRRLIRRLGFIGRDTQSRTLAALREMFEEQTQLPLVRLPGLWPMTVPLTYLIEKPVLNRACQNTGQISSI
jgi:mRNA interferase MazF